MKISIDVKKEGTHRWLQMFPENDRDRFNIGRIYQKFPAFHVLWDFNVLREYDGKNEELKHMSIRVDRLIMILLGKEI